MFRGIRDGTLNRLTGTVAGIRIPARKVYPDNVHRTIVGRSFTLIYAISHKRPNPSALGRYGPECTGRHIGLRFATHKPFFYFDSIDGPPKKAGENHTFFLLRPIIDSLSARNTVPETKKRRPEGRRFTGFGAAPRPHRSRALSAAVS